MRWLSHGCMISCLFKMQHKIKLFLCETEQKLAGSFEEHELVQNLAYVICSQHSMSSTALCRNKELA